MPDQISADPSQFLISGNNKVPGSEPTRGAVSSRKRRIRIRVPFELWTEQMFQSALQRIINSPRPNSSRSSQPRPSPPRSETPLPSSSTHPMTSTYPTPPSTPPSFSL
ncbi:7286_t:CDS:2 [Funneliformis geosporum]|uniref:7286_t:CDS:1 n=1 Tax=Funneliformis geosporum TaxID=1117311 RepID=A0A9W4SY56_9GLOM|nr:7286_t:CDS:2 [Funneliformis geosporum]